MLQLLRAGYLCIFSSTVSSSCIQVLQVAPNSGWVVNNQVNSWWKEAVMAWLEVHRGICLVGLRKTKPVAGELVSWPRYEPAPLVYKSWTLQLMCSIFRCISSMYSELQKFTTQTLLSLNDLDNNSPRVLLCTSLHILQITVIFNFWCFIIIADLFYYSTVDANQNYVLLYYGVIKHILIVFFILVLTNLTMTTLVAETCWRPLCYKITSIKP